MDDILNDPQYKDKIESARADGYTDQQIRDFLENKPPVSNQQPYGQHSESHAGTVEAAAVNGASDIGNGLTKVAEYAIPAAGLYYGGKAIANRFPKAGPVAPAQPASSVPPSSGFDAGGQKVADFNAGRAPNGPTGLPGEAPIRPANPQMPAGSMPPGYSPKPQGFGPNAIALAQRYAPMAARLGTGLTLGTYSPNLNAGEDEQIRRIHAQQDAQMKIDTAIRDRAAQKALAPTGGPVAPGQ